MTPISKQVFASKVHPTLPQGGPLPMHDEREWFEHEDRLGTVIFDKIDSDWSFVALAFSPKKKWQAYDTDCSLPSADAARERLEAALAAGPEGDDWWE